MNERILIGLACLFLISLAVYTVLAQIVNDKEKSDQFGRSISTKTVAKDKTDVRKDEDAVPVRRVQQRRPLPKTRIVCYNLSEWYTSHTSIPDRLGIGAFT